MGLWFGFVQETALIIQGFFFISEQFLHRVKTFSSFHPIPPARCLKVDKNLEVNIAGTADPI